MYWRSWDLLVPGSPTSKILMSPQNLAPDGSFSALPPKSWTQQFTICYSWILYKLSKGNLNITKSYLTKEASFNIIQLPDIWS
jgi:hypothetical protein